MTSSEHPAANAGRDVFYPIVPDADWIARLVPLGLRTVQLRLKDESADEVHRQIAAALVTCREHGCQLIVNDYWRAALALGADYIHLGQEDLAEADLHEIRKAGLTLGLSTHDDAELETALAAEPNYIALGPIFPTTLKSMRFAPQGIPKITEWKQRAGNIPLVAIGGIKLEQAPEIFAAGADSIAVVSDITQNTDPDARVKAWLDQVIEAA